MEKRAEFQVSRVAQVFILMLLLTTSLVRLLIAFGIGAGLWVAVAELLANAVLGTFFVLRKSWSRQLLIGLALFNATYFALRGLLHGEIILAIYEAVISLLILAMLFGRPSRLRAILGFVSYCFMLGAAFAGLVFLSARNEPTRDAAASARAASRYKSSHQYEVSFDQLPWRMMTADQTQSLFGSRIEEADLRLIREDGTSFALFFPLRFNNTKFSPELGVELGEEIEHKWLTDLHSWQHIPLEEGFLLTADGEIGQVPLAYAIFYKHFGNFGLYAVFWSEAKNRERLREEAEAFYSQLTAAPLKQRLPKLSAAETYSLNSDAVVLINVYDANGEVVGRGSGFNVAQSGIIITNLHVLAEGNSIEVVFPKDGTYQDIRIAGVSGATADLAILAIEDGHALPMVKAVQTVSVSPGDVVYVIGNPKGLVNSVSEGIVGGIRAERDLILYQITAAISQGSSGGPVFNEFGEVIGVASALIADAQNLNFSVAIDELRNLFLLPQPLSIQEFHLLLNADSSKE